MNEIVLVIVIFSAAAYLFALLPPVIRFSRLPKTVSEKQQLPALTVLVPARNEAHTILHCLQALQAQEAAAEIIVVNDHSEDNTAEIAASFPGVRVVHLDEKQQGKKAAIMAGIAAASGEIILVTDADCNPPPQWSRLLAAQIQGNVQMAFGPIVLQGKNGLLKAVQETESIAVQAVSAGLLDGGVAFTASGASMCYVRSLPAQTGGYANDTTPSGDDVLLLLRAHVQQPGTVKWVHNVSAAVPAAAAQRLNEFFAQRIRWASKYNYYRSGRIQFIGAAVAANSFILWLLLVLTCFFPQLILLLLLNILLKFAADFLLLSLAITFFRKPNLLLWFIAAWPVYQLCIPLITIGAFAGRFSWKNRKYLTKTPQA
jgi:cellulose synthase/poly-beta-1,6-N-acetylglucosamine synthase-like glycosyltransferase